MASLLHMRIVICLLKRLSDRSKGLFQTFYILSKPSYGLIDNSRVAVKYTELIANLNTDAKDGDYPSRYRKRFGHRCLWKFLRFQGKRRTKIASAGRLVKGF